MRLQSQHVAVDKNNATRQATSCHYQLQHMASIVARSRSMVHCRCHSEPDALSQQRVPRSVALRRGAAALAISMAALLDSAPSSQAISCPGLSGYALSKCLKEVRKQREQEEDVEEERLKYRQYEQPGELVTLPSGIQYREIERGTGKEAIVGGLCDIRYTVYRLASGGYYKYSSGGTPVFLFSQGYGQQGQDDLGDVYRFRLGEQGSVPVAVTLAMVGMQEGGRRRVLVPPQLGWRNDQQVGPKPPSFGAQRRLVAHKDEPLLFEAELVKVKEAEELPQAELAKLGSIKAGTPYQLPAPPTPFKKLLAPAQ